MFVESKNCFLGSIFSAKVYFQLEKRGHASEGVAEVFLQFRSVYIPPCKVLVTHFITSIYFFDRTIYFF